MKMAVALMAAILVAGCAAPIVRDVGYWPVANKADKCAKGATLSNDTGCVMVDTKTAPISCAIYTDEAGISSDGHGALLRACFSTGGNR